MTPLVFLDRLRTTVQKATARSRDWTPTESKIFSLLVWAPINVKRPRGTTYVAGMARAVFSMLDHLKDPVAPEIQTLLWMTAEAMEHDAPLPDEQMEAALAALDALRPRKAA